MSKYSTGELAKLCDVSVRTVQYYDKKDLLKPSELSEGGRRLYTETDRQKLQLICVLKTMGLSLDAIGGVLTSKKPNKVLKLLLQEQKKQINTAIKAQQQQLDTIKLVESYLQENAPLPETLTHGVDAIMESDRKLKHTRGILLGVGLVMDAIEIGTLIYGIITGTWLPFLLGMIIVILCGIGVFRLYYHSTAYICSNCGSIFQTGAKEYFFSYHKPNTRKLTCPECHEKDWCVEIYNDKKE